MIINSTKFGSITIDNRLYDHDVIITKDKQIHKRNKSRSNRIHGHRELAKVEIEELVDADLDVLFLGMGQYGSLPMSDATRSYLETTVASNKVELIQGKTPDILQKINSIISTEKLAAGILHVTC